ncbi:hypothetical protein NPIL_365501 [Nephila pilipes]|uniref:Uncharacterized protein n=1 Tax=Nephila pilipes TaxID=299642 RepID=A0A8X6Q3U0_NEPPI|nr:hypothetical protein NPIL_365501 [Nephila pilipes]
MLDESLVAVETILRFCIYGSVSEDKAATIKHRLKKYKDKFPDNTEIVQSSLFVDDFISGQENVDKAPQTSLESIDIFKEVGMSLRKWYTNSKEIERLWTENKVSVENHSPGKENPADFFTRGLSVSKLAKCDAWWNGANWLCQRKENWPNREVQGVEEENLELRKKLEKTIQNQCVLDANDHVLDLKSIVT